MDASLSGVSGSEVGCGVSSQHSHLRGVEEQGEAIGLPT